MKQKLIKLIATISREDLMVLLSFVQDEDIEFIESANYDNDEAIAICQKFFENKKPETMRIISREFLEFAPKLHAKLFISRRSSATAKRDKSGKITFTENQRLLLNQIKAMINRSDNDKVRTDFIKLKDKSKFFIGGVMTTLIEKEAIKVEIIDNKKFVSLI